MPFSKLIGNETIKKLLARAVAQERISQSLIFAGPRGVGKHRFALTLAQTLNCERPAGQDACGTCLPCRKIDAGEHPDVRTLVPEGAFIKIEQTRAMSRDIQYRPYEGRRKVWIIDEADRLKEQAANAILKTLEEPPPSSLLVSITDRPYALLPTIRSRCQMLNFAPLRTVELSRYLAAEHGIPREEAELRARVAEGSVGRALTIDAVSYREKRTMLLQLLEVLAIHRDTVRALNAAENLGRKLDRDEFIDHFAILITLLADLLKVKVQCSVDALVNVETAPTLRRLAEAVSVDWIIRLSGKLETVRQNMIRNVNRQLALESVFVSM